MHVFLMQNFSGDKEEIAISFRKETFNLKTLLAAVVLTACFYKVELVWDLYRNNLFITPRFHLIFHFRSAQNIFSPDRLWKRRYYISRRDFRQLYTIVTAYSAKKACVSIRTCALTGIVAKTNRVSAWFFIKRMRTSETKGRHNLTNYAFKCNKRSHFVYSDVYI